MPVTWNSTETCSVLEGEEPLGGSLLVFADDWGRHPSSCQHLVRHLLGRHDVYWVNTIGTRPPRLDLATLRRGLEKLRHWSRPASPGAQQHPRLHVLNPRMWPSFRSPFGRLLNRQLLVRQLAPLLRSLPEPAVAISTIPLVAELIGLLPVARWVYYCVDDFGQWPGLDQKTLARLEEQLVARADTVIAVSENLQTRLATLGRSSHLLTHGVEPDFWAAPAEAPSLAPLEGLERPLVTFWGVVDQRMDVAFVERLARALPRGTLVLAGPAADPDPALDRLPRLRRLGPLEFTQLPVLARDSAVLVMPYADLPVTRAIQPLKLKEYLATGRPVVVRDLPATRPWAECLDLAATPDAFVQAVRLRLETGVPAEQRSARRRLRDEGWAEKARQFEQWIFAPA
jgi:glycosyltransferase involved in cell wall biosynthesis